MTRYRAQWVVTIIAFFLFTSCLIWLPRVYLISGQSMMPTLQDGEYVLVVHNTYKIERFDIVIILDKEKLIIKRIVGLPGEDVRYINGHLVINKKEVLQSFLPISLFQEIEAYHFQLKEDEFMVLGDNRLNSHDSRAMGPINQNKILGKMAFEIW